MTPAAWLVRGGREGEHEQAALRDGLVITGWSNLGNLAGCAGRDQLQTLVQRSHPERNSGTIADWTDQLWRLLVEMSDGDLVVLPLLTRPQHLAVGRVTGPYSYRPEMSENARHVRPVTWLRTDLPRAAINQDLLGSMESLLTICELNQFDAARRIEHLASVGADPGIRCGGILTNDSATTPAELLAHAVAADGSLELSVRNILSRWKSSQLTPEIIYRIEAELADQGLAAQPSIAEGWLDDTVRFVRTSVEPGSVEDNSEDSTIAHLSPLALRLSMLRSAGAGVKSVRPDDTLGYAMTIMIECNYSQLAVIDGEGILHGAVSWESIGLARMANEPDKVIHATKSTRPVSGEDSLLDHLDEIYRSDYVFVLGAGNNIDGVVTAADLTLQFGAQVRPFVLVEEVERRLRRRVDEVFSEEEINSAARGRVAKSAADLTLANYQSLFRDPVRWRRINWKIDHDHFLKKLEELRIIRNGLMHFTRDATSEKNLARVEGFVRMLRAVDPRALR